MEVFLSWSTLVNAFDDSTISYLHAMVIEMSTLQFRNIPLPGTLLFASWFFSVWSVSNAWLDTFLCHAAWRMSENKHIPIGIEAKLFHMRHNTSITAWYTTWHVFRDGNCRVSKRIGHWSFSAVQLNVLDPRSPRKEMITRAERLQAPRPGTWQVPGPRILVKQEPDNKSNAGRASDLKKCLGKQTVGKGTFQQSIRTKVSP